MGKDLIENYTYYFLSLFKIGLLTIIFPVVFLLLLVSCPIIWIKQVRVVLSNIGDLVEDVIEW